ncbi:pleckstrin homology domain-containing family F member 1-like [Cololabis saira]|uniref:pleckstrin homology domain-containing family F member 1-like n=1 Tax=Cololabis saira TaxID=129043 RepID=UPI002AD39486|nr:pleckstrin homology domain-containing family F member 1-like [Cololabis saira]
MDQLTFERNNRKRIQEVENTFGPSGTPLSRSSRVLMGEGILMKQGRKKWERKAFFLFNDVLVYGSIIMNDRWYKNQKIIPLEDLKLEDMEDGVRFKHQWLISTPFKSFIVAAQSYEEKQAWMKHISDCQSSLVQDGSCKPSAVFAVSWIPEDAAEVCMRCFRKFTAIVRRHHCRKCGILVCNQCSKQRAVIHHIHPTKQLRICKLCHGINKEENKSRLRGDSAGNCSLEDQEWDS